MITPRNRVANASRPSTQAVYPEASLEASGYVVARRVATVSANRLGELVEVSIEEGQAVAVGDVLARLNDEEQRATWALAAAQHERAVAAVEEYSVDYQAALNELVRGQRLAERALISTAGLEALQQRRDQAQARLLVAQSQVRVATRQVAVAQVAIDESIVRAPFAGVVVNKTAQLGEIVSPMSAGGSFTRTGIGTIVDMHSLEVEVDISEGHINRVFPAQRVEILLNAYPDSPFDGHVVAVIPTADRSKATIRVRVAIEAVDDRVLPHMGVRVAFMKMPEKVDVPYG